MKAFSSVGEKGTGVSRAVMVNLNQSALYAQRLSAEDVGNALASTNVVIPSGAAKMGNYQYNVDLNMSPQTTDDFNRLPIKVINGTPILLGNVAPVTDTHQPQTNVVRFNGRPATYLMVIKHAAASTMAVVDSVKARIPEILAVALSSEALALHRLLLAEAQRFPELARVMSESGANMGAERIAGLLAREQAAGRLGIADCRFAAEQFINMVLAVPRRRALGFGEFMSAGELERWLSQHDVPEDLP